MISNISNLTLDLIIKELVVLILSFCVGIVLITYILNLPTKITGNREIVEEYYLKNFVTSIPADLFFVFIYFLIAGFVMRVFEIKEDITKLIVVGITTAILTGLACYYFISKKLTTGFFSRWFHSVGYLSAIYDVVLLVFIYAIFLFIKNKTKLTTS
tara:strand:+ start:475 stop:945 length:471 start_codon:yes stop_codon:yes gene_type:complete